LPLAAAVLAGLLALTPCQARAQQPGAAPHEVTAADKETARALMDAADAKLAAGDARGALDAYVAADKIMGVPTTGLEVGRTQAKLSLLLEARDTLLRVTRYAQDASEPAAFTKARQEASTLAASLAARIPSLQVEVKGPQDDHAIAVTVDGVVLPAGMHRLPRKVNPGAKVIRVTAEGYKASEQAITLAEGEQRVATFALAALPAPPAAPEPAGLSPLVWIGFGVGGAALVVGTITGGLSLSKTSDAKAQCADTICKAGAQDDIDAALLNANLSNVSFAVAAVGVVLGVVGIAISDEPPSEAQGPSAVRAKPWVGIGTVGLTGTF